MKNKENQSEDYKKLEERVKQLENLLNKVLKLQKRHDSKLRILNTNTISITQDVANIRSKFRHGQ